MNPADDDSFRRAVEEHGPRSETPAQLQGILRAWFPRTVVRAADLEAEPVTRWYVYRDGIWVR